MPLPRFLDVEASSLDSSSYPIEVAWSDANGIIESHLINPYAVESWTNWDFSAQQIHGISRKQCRENGVHPKFLCDRLSQSIRPGEIIYADGIPFDAWWIDSLYEAGSTLGYAQFRILHSDSVLLPLLTQAEANEPKRWRLYERLKLEARRKVGARHRACADVKYLIALWQLCIGQTAR